MCVCSLYSLCVLQDSSGSALLQDEEYVVSGGRGELMDVLFACSDAVCTYTTHTGKCVYSVYVQTFVQCVHTLHTQAHIQCVHTLHTQPHRQCVHTGTMYV